MLKISDYGYVTQASVQNGRLGGVFFMYAETCLVKNHSFTIVTEK